MTSMKELREMLCKELNEITYKGELSAGDLDTVHKLTDTIKNIDKIERIEEDGAYSNGGDWRAYGAYSRARDFSRGNSYASRRGMHYVRGHYSRGDDMEEFEEQIRDMMGNPAISEPARIALNRALSEMHK